VANYSIALLRFKWRDQANAIPTWPHFAYTGCYLPIRPKGVARYWQERTFGLANLEGSIVYPWRVLDLDMPQTYLDRESVIRHAIERGLDEGFPLLDFERVVVVVIPNNNIVKPKDSIDGGALPPIQLRGGTWTTALLAEDYEFDFLAHEDRTRPRIGSSVALRRADRGGVRITLLCDELGSLRSRGILVDFDGGSCSPGPAEILVDDVAAPVRSDAS
jgi:hypothetical protein